MLRKYIVAGCFLLIQQATAQTVSYVRTWDAKIPVTDPGTLSSKPVSEVLQTTAYVDGLGRPYQTIVKEGSFLNSSNTKTDLVSFFVYDDFGREVKKYIPFAASTSTGTYKTDPVNEQYSFYTGQLSGQNETFFYSNSDVETSPLNRVKKTYPPGNSWVGASRGVAMTYLNNTTNDQVKVWTVNSSMNYSISGNYDAGLLIETHTTDEHDNQVVEYKDNEGKVILKKVQIETNANLTEHHGGWLCTYYIYDKYNNLRLVLPPKAVAALGDANWNTTTTLTNSFLNELAFRYEYDNKNRMSIKKVPGAAEVYMVYDKWDRLVLTQDGNLRATNKWIFTKYDDKNRPVMTGFYTDATHTGQAGMQTYVDGLMSTAGRYESLNGSTNGYTTTSSFPSLSSPDLLTISFYDNYNWATGSYAAFASMDNSNNGLFYSGGTPLYAQTLTAVSQIKGQVTGTITYVLNSGSGQKLVSSIFYDDRGRAIQSKAQNIAGGTDITTTQYNFSGQPLMSLLVHDRPGTAGPIKTITKMNYDDLGRFKEVKKKIFQQLSGSTVPASPVEKIIVQNEYDKLGQLVTKKLAPEFNSNAGLEQIEYSYNIRGWLMSLNKDYLSGTNNSRYFGLELAYDKSTTVVPGVGYDAVQYNGNITGTSWKTKGAGLVRKYDFAYDNVNRLLRGDFDEKDNNGIWVHDKVDFSMKMGNGTDYATAYDENGNIKQMQHMGLQINASTQIDNLNYTYFSNSNKLKNVIDFNDVATTKLGDFRTSTNHAQYSSKIAITTPAAFATSGPAISDYGYDMNGNMISDRNKDMTGNVGIDQASGGAISYNHLNLPSVITVSGKGTITYVYDAAGIKLQKITVETGATVPYNGTNYTTNITTTTDYIAGFVYETKSYSNSTVNTALGYTTKLQFGAQEEGRIRALYANAQSPNTITGFGYDYMLKDHLGNVRMLLTDEVQTDHYPTATLEANAVAQEQNYFDINTGNVVAKPTPLPTESSTLLDYINDNGTNNPNTFGNPNATSQKMLRLSTATSQLGLGMVLKVMAGDKFNILGKSYYQYQGSQATNTSLIAAGIIGAFLSVGGASNPAVIHGATSPILNSNTSGTVNPINGFLNNSGNTNPSNNVRAGICYILFDEQFNFVSGYFDPVYNAGSMGGHGGGGPEGGLKNHFMQDVAVTKNGYIYVYCSNESNINVFFDNLELVHTRGPILEETHYYPFGLTMAGISTKAAGMMDNKFEYNGQEKQEEFDIEWYQYKWRNYDPQIGRFFCIDPLAPKFEYLTPYQFASNNPISMREIEGLEGIRHQEVGEDGKIIRHVVQETVYVVVVEDWDRKAAGKRRPKGRVKSTYQSEDVAEVKRILNDLFNGNDGQGSKNSDGETVFFEFDVKEKNIGSTDPTSQEKLKAINTRELGTESGEVDYNDQNTGQDVYKKAPATLMIGGMSEGLGDNDNLATKIARGKEFDGETILHEMLHQFLTRPQGMEHKTGGALGEPQENFNPRNVDDILKDAYKSRTPIKVIKKK